MRSWWSVVAFFIVLGAFEGKAADEEYYSGQVINGFGSLFTLEIKKSGSRLSFDLAARSGTTTLDGTPKCESASLGSDGSYSTYCSGFGNGVAGTNSRVRLVGTLQQAQLDIVPRFGNAEIALKPGPLKR